MRRAILDRELDVEEVRFVCGRAQEDEAERFPLPSASLTSRGGQTWRLRCCKILLLENVKNMFVYFSFSCVFSSFSLCL